MRQIAEELRSFQHGARGLWLLHLNGAAYTQKPPLYFWLAALAGAPAGRVSEAAARLPSALAGIACVALVIRFGTRLRGPAVGIAAGGLLATATLFAHLARRAQLDVLLCRLELVALAAFWRIDRGGPRRARDVAVLHGALGLAVLTKGPVGLILPALAIVAFLAWERRLGGLRRCLPAWAPLLSVAPGLVWIAGAVALAPPGFAQTRRSSTTSGGASCRGPRTPARPGTTSTSSRWISCPGRCSRRRWSRPGGARSAPGPSRTRARLALPARLARLRVRLLLALRGQARPLPAPRLPRRGPALRRRRGERAAARRAPTALGLRRCSPPAPP